MQVVKALNFRNVIFCAERLKKGNAGNVALVSGFSPSIMTAVLGAKDMSPVSVMLETLNSERYAAIK